MNKYKFFISTIIYFFVLNTVFAILLYKHITISNLCFYFFESITISSLITLFTEIFKGKKKKIVSIILVFIVSLLFLSQYVHYSFYDCLYSFFSVTHSGQILGFVSTIIKIISEHLLGFVLLIVLFVTFAFIIIKLKEIGYKKRPIVVLMVLIINLCLSLTVIFTINTDDLYSRKNLLLNTNMELKNAQKFGLVSAMIIDLDRYITGYNYNFYNNNSDNTVYDKNKYNVLDTSFDNDELSTYLMNSTPTMKNIYTGIFKGKNLIFITAESFDFDIINKDITPTLYELYSNGFSFSNFYTPIYYASTSDGEYTNLTGLYPRDGSWSYISSLNKDYPYTYAKVFNGIGYKSYGYHNGEYNFYERYKVMPNFGYSFKGCGNGLENYINCDIWPQSDDEMISSTFDDYKNDEKFNTYYMSISGHLYHDFKTNAMAKKYKKEVKNLNYHESTNAYISANIDLDKALEHLIDNLKKSNKLDDTVIVLVPDHYPYGLSSKELSDIKKLDSVYAKHKSNLIIYNSATKGAVTDKYASNVDILPTLLNMFGIEFDSRLIIGKDIMSSNDGIVIFNDRSFLTDKGFYNEKTNKFTSFGDNVKNDYINNNRLEVYNKVNASSMIEVNNYYKNLKK